MLLDIGNSAGLYMKPRIQYGAWAISTCKGSRTPEAGMILTLRGPQKHARQWPTAPKPAQKAINFQILLGPSSPTWASLWQYSPK